MSRLVTSRALLIAALVAFLVACASEPGRPSSPVSNDPKAIRISADDLVFSTVSLSAPADQPFQIAFDNRERAPHNVAIYRDSTASERIFGSEPFSGPAVQTYDVPALAAGIYAFRCDVHPDMEGRLIVE